MRLLCLLMIGLITCSEIQVSAQSTTVVQATGETYLCPKCGKMHTRASTPVQSQAAVREVVTAPRGVAAVGFSSGPVTRGISNVLDALNGQRTRQGLRSLRYDPQLQAVAERRAQQMASSGQKGHPPGSFAPGRYEGVGWSSSYSPSGVSACYTSDSRMQAAGAAMATGRDGVYFAVVYR